MKQHTIWIIVSTLCATALFQLRGSSTFAQDTGPATDEDKAVPERPEASPNAVLDSTAAPKTSADGEGNGEGEAVRLAGLATWSVSLAASSSDLWPTHYTTLTATANQDVGPTPYYIAIYDDADDLAIDAPLATCGYGTVCSVAVTKSFTDYRNYIAVITEFDGSGSSEAFSSLVSVSWKYYLSLALRATPTTVSIGSSTTVTATSSDDVGPSPFYIEIFDADTGDSLATCGFGRTCSASVTQQVATTHELVAYIAPWSATSPPAGILRTADPTWVTWSDSGWSVSLRRDQGGESVTAVSNGDVGPTPYWIEIFDITSGQQVAMCGSGTVCTAEIGQVCSAGPFVAFVSDGTATFLPREIQASSRTISLVNPC